LLVASTADGRKRPKYARAGSEGSNVGGSESTASEGMLQRRTPAGSTGGGVGVAGGLESAALTTLEPDDTEDGSEEGGEEVGEGAREANENR
jgi:hypothetical protein